MTRYIYQGTFVDQLGNVIPSGTITVYLAGTTTAASVYTASTGGTAVNNVTSSTTNGTFLFYVDPDDYNLTQQFKIVLSKTNFASQTVDNITIFPNEVPDIDTLANSATPSVTGVNNWLTGGTTTITDLTGGFTGKIIRILAEHTITITDGTNIFLNGSANFTMNSTDSLTLIQKADGNWYELSRSDNT